jgi:transglutaminase-like putative cysteine protease/tetratricopeptide (TPR) repeat protein
VAAAFVGAGLIGAPAIAGEDILYRPAPEWVEKASLPADPSARSGTLQVLDQQLRLEEGTLWEYLDTAVRIGTPQELTESGTLSATWLPDKGDLIVHEVSILRGDEVIDVLARGSRLDILRREESLEQRILDGQLTATMPVPGLQVGDVLRIRYTTSLSDQALGREVQSLSYLFREPDFRAGFARIRASWPAAADVGVAASNGVQLPEVEESGGYRWLELDLPLKKAEDVPRDAPPRFHMPAVLQIGTFDGWTEVSRVMAPYYDVGGAIASDSELARRASAIRGAHSGALEQAVAALELVQEEIGYLASGLDGGNYLPQSPTETWELRYGDCKAKTLLLLALLDQLGIEAEPVLVSSIGGDRLPELLPMAAAFDHVLVRARIDGAYYWLDGTSAGANVRVAGNVPPFGYALPVRASGAELEQIRQLLPRVPEMQVTVDFDQTAGVDIPALFKAQFELVGVNAAMFNAGLSNLTDEQLIQTGSGLVYPILGMSQVLAVNPIKGSDDSELSLEVEGLLTTLVKYDGSRGEQRFNLPGSNIAFAPDRARRQWRDIPVHLGQPNAAVVTLRHHLPGDGAGFVLTGATEIDQTLAGVHLVRSARLEQALLTITEQITSLGGELAPDQIAAEKQRAASLSRNQLLLKASDSAERSWHYAGKTDRSALAKVEAAYQRQIDREPDEVEHYLNRARFRQGTYDFAGALADYTAAIELQSSADIYEARSRIYADLRQRDKSRDDLQTAWELDPNPNRALALAFAMADTGDVEGARELLEQQDGDDNVRRSLELVLADFDGREGRADAGLERIETLLADRPNDPQLLNAKCWHMAAWQVALEEAENICTRAVEAAPFPPPVLDSRALAFLRTGDLAKALADANAALTTNPGQHQTLLLRGLIRRASGDQEGEKDIMEAMARTLAEIPVYTRYGFDLD